MIVLKGAVGEVIVVPEQGDEYETLFVPEVSEDETIVLQEGAKRD